MNAWGFTYYTLIIWNKLTGPCPFGPYQITTEQILFGYKGKACFSRNGMDKLKTFFTEVSTAHSAKPTSFYAQICKWFEGPRLDVFACQSHVGFDRWGDSNAEAAYADMLYEGEGGDRDVSQALVYVKRTLEKDETNAYLLYSKMLLRGEDGPTNPTKARQYAKKAALAAVR